MGPGQTCKKCPERTELLRSASEQSPVRKPLDCSIKSCLAMFKLNSCFLLFCRKLVVKCSDIQQRTSVSKCLHLLGQGDQRRHAEASLQKAVLDAAVPGRLAHLSNSLRLTWKLPKGTVVCSGPPRPLGLATWHLHL